MDILKVLLINFIAVGVMTVFTYLYSLARNINFGQPYLLQYLINTARPSNNRTTLGIWVGWLLHYILGILFYYGYQLFRTLLGLTHSVWLGILYGFFAGLIGVIGWYLMFRAHRNPPAIPKTEYYLQLVVAHILFGLSVAILLLKNPF
ncbi:hypothetical protein [Luteirhabdus pelagi]|uniref:hypothetical protein n=1 Tax=Luteirhabdus pelagi TaxID=2792783 RepID=UPI0019394ADE|nr:hypothetical protein [Luteirhabdus pelagi]